MDASRLLVVQLQNAAAKAREAIALDELPATTARLEEAKTAAIISQLETAQAKARAAMSRPRRGGRA